MGIRQSLIVDMNNLPRPYGKPGEPVNPIDSDIRNGKRDTRFQITYPSITYKTVEILRKNLKLEDTPIVKGNIAWDPCEHQARKRVTGTIEYQMGYILAAAILGDKEKLQHGCEKGYPMFTNPERTFTGLPIKKEEELVYVKCVMETGDSVPYNMVEIHEYSLWGMLLWPVWEKENDFHRFLWKMINEEYRCAAKDTRWEMQKIIFDSIDSLYILKYQEKAMKICERELPDLCTGPFAGLYPPYDSMIRRPVDDPIADDEAMGWRLYDYDMCWEMNIMESWVEMYMFVKDKIFPHLINSYIYYSWQDETVSIARSYVWEWRKAIEDADRNDRLIMERDNSYLEKGWKIKNVIIKAWKNRIWSEDEISRQMEKLELEEYNKGRHGEKLKLRFILSMRLLEKLVRTQKDEAVQANYVYFMGCLWDELEEGPMLNRQLSQQGLFMEDEVIESYIREIKKRLIELSKKYPTAKEHLANAAVRYNTLFLTRKEALERCLQRLLFCKNQMFPEKSKLRMDMDRMASFITLSHPKAYTEEAWEYTPLDSFWGPMETDGDVLLPAGELEERNGIIRKIWKLLDFYGFREDCLSFYQERILERCNESDFLYARSCGLFPDSTLNKAKLYAAERENLKVLPALICLTASQNE